MKRLLLLLISLAMAFAFAGCGDSPGKVSDVKVTMEPSSIYSEDDIQAAVTAAEEYFSENFNGCEMLEIAYPGDDITLREQEYREAEDVIVLISSFHVGRNGGDGSLNQNDTYEDWLWILEKDKDGNWNHVDHGYG